MARVRMEYDDGSSIEFLDAADALYHATVQGAAGVVGVKDEEHGESVWTRKQLNTRVAEVQEHGADIDTARRVAKE
jgi:hypothetical protein